MRTGWFCVWLCWALFSMAPVNAADRVHDDALNALAAQPRWQALLHVNPGATLRDKHRSYVDDANFFLAPNGKDDAVAELIATRDALAPQGAPARCRFPARYRFLAQALGWQSAAPFAHCDEFTTWRQSVNASRAVLIFPAAYLNSPSSMFGHTLLRLDQGEDSAVWLSWAVNYGAVSSGADNSLFYIYRGLAGGYPGRFSIVPYVKKIQEYSHMENRDMWEYTLDLNQEEINWLIDHLWELKDVNFDYYFFDENCSFRLLELVEVARPGLNLLTELRFAEVPVNTVRALDDAGVIHERVYRPSKAVELDRLQRQLSPAHQRLARKLADDTALLNTPSFLSLSSDEQAHIIAVAYRYLRLTHRKKERSSEVSQRSFQLLTAMNSLPPVSPLEGDHETMQPPESGHGTQMLAVSGGQHESDDFGELSYRLTYHDLLDNSPGFLQGAEIEGLNMTFRSTESQAAKLEQLRVVGIRSLAPRNRFIKPLSWYVDGGIERVWAGRYRLARYVQGGAGASWRWGRWQPYGLFSLRAENNSEFDRFAVLGAGFDTGVLYRSGRMQWLLGSAGHYFNNDFYRHTSQLALQWQVARQHGLRASIAREGWRGDGENEFKIQWRWYFD